MSLRETFRRNDEMIAFLKAVAAASPKDVARDRFGRISGARDTDQLRLLAVKYKIEDGGQDSLDQAAMIARKILESFR